MSGVRASSIEDRVHLVDDGEVVPTLNHLIEAVRHVVAQVIETELGIRPVGDVGGIGVTLGVEVRDVGNDQPHAQPQEAMDSPHPLGVAAQVVVHGHEVHTLSTESIEVGGQRRNERLPLAGTHLRDPAEMKSRTTHQLDVEMALPQSFARPPHASPRRPQPTGR